jgi:hypothetical protein
MFLKLIYILTSLQIHNKIIRIFTENVHYYVYSSSYFIQSASLWNGYIIKVKELSARVVQKLDYRQRN